MENYGILLSLGIIVTVVVCGVWAGVTATRRRRLRAVAAHWGWDYTPTDWGWTQGRRPVGFDVEMQFRWGSPRDIMTGQHGSSTFVAFTTPTSDKKNPVYGVVAVRLPVVLPEVVLTREGLGTMVAKAFGGQDLLIGHPAFDARYRIQAHDIGYVSTLLNPAVIAWLMAPVRWDQFTVKNQYLVARTTDGLSYEHLPWMLDDLAYLVSCIGDDVWRGWGVPT
ncbi:MAG: hypothetical protein FWD11_04180 [Micrococcales bacterium]|nr:hypothetical protein [Micrococcales bacterium]